MRPRGSVARRRSGWAAAEVGARRASRTHRTTQGRLAITNNAAVAMTTMALLNLTLLILSERHILPLGWSWLVILGTLGTFGLAWFLGPVLDGEKRRLTA